MIKQQTWKWQIDSHSKWFQWNLKELLPYKDLLRSFVKRDLTANYKQTLLGPFWVILQPLLTTAVYCIIFGRVAKVSTDGVPPVLFYLPGVIIWSYFSDCLNGTMYTFLQNVAVFNKVYFPRLIVPVSTVIVHTFRLLIQLLLFALLFTFYFFSNKSLHPSPLILLLPVLIFIAAAFSFSCGLIISVFTARYRDLDYALQFLLRLFMFAAPVVYPTSIVPEKYKFIFWLNPLTPVIETFRLSFFGNGTFQLNYFLASILSVTVLLIISITLFKKRELQVMDVI